MGKFLAPIGLQFQDRVSQILTHVVSNMNSLRDEVETNADGDFDIEAWLRGMTRDFTTQEEFETFHGTNISNANPKIHDTTFLAGKSWQPG